jgi:hypothetical protein
VLIHYAQTERLETPSMDKPVTPPLTLAQWKLKQYLILTFR